MLEFDVCHCDCHRYPDLVKHCMPCCYECPHCGQRIKTFCYDRHVDECGEALRHMQAGLPYPPQEPEESERQDETGKGSDG